MKTAIDSQIDSKNESKFDPKLERNLKLMMVHSIFLEPLFWGSILILAMQKLAHMSLSEIYFQEAVVVVLCLIIDIPTGALADIIGRKKMIVIGQIFLFFDFLVFAFMSEPWHVWVANILWAIGVAFRSGADKALIQESCLGIGKGRGYYRKYSGKAQGLRMLLFAICAPATSWVATYDLRWPMFMSIPFLIIPLVTVFMLTEPPRDDVKKLTTREHISQMKEGVLDIIRDKRIFWIMLYTCIITAVLKIWFFAYNPYFERVSLPLIWFGWIFAGLNVIGWISSQWGFKVEKKLGDKVTLLLLIPMIGISVILMGLFPIKYMVGMVFFASIVRGMYIPFFDSMSEHYLRNSTRATVLSVQSSVSSAVGSIGLLGFSFLVKYTSLLTSLIVLGITALVCHLLLMSTWNKHFKV